jgi:beta-lactamase regulating signal transducer with metallopeptidase domain
MLSYILQVTICLAVFYTLYAAVLSRETFFGINRWFLLGTLGLSLLIPILPAFVQLNAEPTFASYTLEPVVIGIQDASVALSTSIETPWWLTMLLVIYCTGVGLLCIRFVMGLKSIVRMYNAATSSEKYGAQEIVISPLTSVPFSFFKWIFLPEEHQLTESELSEIVTHESAHGSAGHSIDVLFMELTCIVLWPSPVIYFYRKSLRRVHEYLADAVVLRQTPLKQYGHLLLSRTAPGMQLALANHFFHNQLKHRIMMMTKHKSKRRALAKYTALLPVLLLTLALFAFRGSDYNVSPEKSVTGIVLDTVPGEIFKVVEEMPRFPGCEASGLEGDEISWD